MRKIDFSTNIIFSQQIVFIVIHKKTSHYFNGVVFPRSRGSSQIVSLVWRQRLLALVPTDVGGAAYLLASASTNKKSAVVSSFFLMEAVLGAVLYLRATGTVTTTTCARTPYLTRSGISRDFLRPYHA
ncbi:MAG: hypothetical protein KBC26_00160 [Candidatus Pacebacteria bacterium]|nr:hypothetical protein [Candidatus Paceibacterota bacterium]